MILGILCLSIFSTVVSTNAQPQYLVSQSAAPTITLQPSTTSPTVGTKVTLSGNLSTPESGTLLVYASINGSSAQQIGTTPVTNGAYSYVYNITGPGTYAVYVEMPASAQQGEARSSTVTLVTQSVPVRSTPPAQVPNAGPPEYAIYIVIVAVLAIAAVGGAVMLRRRAASAAAMKAIKQPTTAPLPP